jgi:F-box protein 21
MAVPEWNRLKNGDNVPLERALGAYDMFVLHDREGDFDDVRGSTDSHEQTGS